MTDGVGAYGFRIVGVDIAAGLLNPVFDDRPVITVRQEPLDDSVELRNTVGDDRAEVPFITGGGAVITREPAEAVVMTPVALTAEEIAHPFLAPIASVFAHWQGWIPFHAGGIIVDGVAWGIVGEKEAGKSTLTGAAALRGLPIVADDVLVTDREFHVYAGPRTLDLRQGAADHFNEGRDLGIVGLRERWRFDLPPVPDRTPLGGWIFPRWGDDIAITASRSGDRVRTLVPGRTVRASNIDHRALLRLIALPAVDFTRPKDLDSLDTGLDRLLDVLRSVTGLP